MTRGVRKARVPASFGEKLRSGDVILLNDDIAGVDISSSGMSPYSLAIALMVFPYLKEQGQRLALYNLAKNTEPEGFIVIDRLNVILAWMSFFFKGQYGGWLTETELGELGLRTVETFPVSENYSIYLLQKQK